MTGVTISLHTRGDPLDRADPGGWGRTGAPSAGLALVAASDVAAEPDTATTSDGDGTTLAVIALVVGGLGLIVGVTGLATARRRTD